MRCCCKQLHPHPNWLFFPLKVFLFCPFRNRDDSLVLLLKNQTEYSFLGSDIVTIRSR